MSYYKKIKFLAKLYGYKFETRKNTFDIMFVLPDFELETTRFLLEKKGKVFIDVGSHIGRYTILLSKNFEKIISIEADPYNYSQLIRNLKLNDLYPSSKIIPLNIAASDNFEKVNLYLSEDNGGGHSIEIYDNNRKRIEILAIPIDLLLNLFKISFKDVSLVKIDVEGAELKVLKGMKKLLKEGKPILIIEVWDTNRLNKVKEFLREFEYNLYKVLEKK